MHQTHVVEVVLGMTLIRLLVDQVVLAQVVCLWGVSTSSMCLQFADTLSILLVNPECLDALVDRITLYKAPGFQVGKHAKVLSHCRKVDFFFKVNDIVTKVSLLIESLRDKGFSFSGRAA